MIAAPWPAAVDRSHRAAAVQREFPSAAEPLTVAAYVVPSGAVVVALRGEVDMCTIPLLRDRLRTYLRSAAHQLVLDLGEVSFLGAAGLTVLVDVRQTALAAGVRLCVVARTRLVRLPLMITGLADVLDLHAGVDGALLCPARGPAR